MNSVRRLARQLVGSNSIVMHSKDAHLLKLHPLVTSLLIESSFWDVYVQSQEAAFNQLQNEILYWLES